MEQPTAAKKTEQILAILILSILVIVGLIYFVINPQLTKLSENNLNYGAKKLEFENKQDKLDNLKNLEPKIEQEKNKVKKLSIALPKENQVAEFLVQLSVISKSAGMNLVSIVPTNSPIMSSKNLGSENTENEVESIKVESSLYQVELIGGYNSLTKVLEQMENNLRPLKVTNIEISSSEVAQNPIMSIILNIEAYFQS